MRSVMNAYNVYIMVIQELSFITWLSDLALDIYSLRTLLGFKARIVRLQKKYNIMLI